MCHNSTCGEWQSYINHFNEMAQMCFGCSKYWWLTAVALRYNNVRARYRHFFCPKVVSSPVVPFCLCHVWFSFYYLFTWTIKPIWFLCSFGRRGKAIHSRNWSGISVAIYQNSEPDHPIFFVICSKLFASFNFLFSRSNERPWANFPSHYSKIHLALSCRSRYTSVLIKGYQTCHHSFWTC